MLFAAALTGAFLTSLYTWRLFLIVFTGEPSAFVREHVHERKSEGPFWMMWPVIVLAVLWFFGLR